MLKHRCPWPTMLQKNSGVEKLLYVYVIIQTPLSCRRSRYGGSEPITMTDLAPKQAANRMTKPNSYRHPDEP